MSGRPFPLAHRIHPDLGVVVTVWTGAATDAEMQRSHRALYGAEAWRPGLNELVDLRGADLTSITLEGMRRLADIVARAMNGSETSFQTALLVSADLAFGMARLYQGHQDDDVGTVQVFRDEGEALDWLGLEAWPAPETGVFVQVGEKA